METENNYHCLLCEYSTNKLSNYTRHRETIRHISKETSLINKEKYKCPWCDFTTYKYSKHVRHLNTKKHILNTQNTRSEPMTTQQVDNLAAIIKQQNETISDKDKTIQQLIKSQQETIQQQQETILKLSERTSISNTYNNHFNLNVFLNETCKDALNWNEFLQNITVSLDPARGNITEQITTAMCSELARLGETKRPIHCTDVKRGSSVVKDDGTWKQNEQALLEDGVESVKRKFVNKTLQWGCEHKEFHKNEEETEEYVKLIATYMKDPDKEKVVKTLIKQAVIDKANKSTMEP